MNSVPRWLRCLARGKAHLSACPGSRQDYGVYTRKDRRRRPIIRVSQSDVEAGVVSGWLIKRDGSLILSDSGHRWVASQTTEQHGINTGNRVMVEKQFISKTGVLETYFVNAKETPLYPWAKSLNPTELGAGETFRTDYALSTLHQRTTQSWDMVASRSGPPGYENLPLSKLEAKDRVMNALSAVTEKMGKVLMAVCIHEESMASVERRFGWGQRSGKTVLKKALRQLAEHYGMIEKT